MQRKQPPSQNQIIEPSIVATMDEVEEQASMIVTTIIHLNLKHQNQVPSMRLVSLRAEVGFFNPKTDIKGC